MKIEVIEPSILKRDWVAPEMEDERDTRTGPKKPLEGFLPWGYNGLPLLPVSTVKNPD